MDVRIDIGLKELVLELAIEEEDGFGASVPTKRVEDELSPLVVEKPLLDPVEDSFLSDTEELAMAVTKY
ncbi:hypothetical protein EG329_009705 [Mollisiaceae sp. DMI_Dod_QoI]|nr:hypothetical protein EG329_009705 [Helotiales sp. DMI_Dod_QoI]